MIAKFENNLDALAVQFETWLTPHLSSIQSIGDEAQKSVPDDPGMLDTLSGRKSAHLARVNALLAPLEAFKDHAIALATAEYPLNTPPMTVKALAKGKTIQYAQAYTLVERLSSTLVHQIKSLDSRVWKAREEIKSGMLGGRA